MMPDSDNLSFPVYFLHMLQDNRMGIQFKWKEIKGLLTGIFGDKICQKLIENEIVETCSDNDFLEITNLNDISFNLSRYDREILYGSVVNILKRDLFSMGIMETVYASRKTGILIMESINFNITVNRFEDRYINLRITMAMLLSAEFYYSETLKNICKSTLDAYSIPMDSYRIDLQKDWFIRIVMLARLNENNNVIYQGPLETGNPDYLDLLEESIKSGKLQYMMLHMNEFLHDKMVNNAIASYEYRKVRRQRIKKLYDWAAIANDMAIGSEFLSGSILFISHNTYMLGVYLFIVASIQLLIKPGIQISRKLQLFKLTHTK
jgi:hypothetical protein